MGNDQIDFAAVHNDNRHNHILRSCTSHTDVLASLTNASVFNSGKWVAGIDEAGRGPVLGPMVYCICAVPACDGATQFLKDCGCADSKVLSEKQRDAVFARMSDKVVWAAKVLSPVYLSREMLRPTKVSLNAISHDAARELTDVVCSYLQPDGGSMKQLFVDTVGPPEKYQQKLLEMFPQIDITVSKKADSLFPIVSAASIIAKIIRDAVLKNWRFEILSMTPGSVPVLTEVALHQGMKRVADEIETLLADDDGEQKRETRLAKRQKSSLIPSSSAVAVARELEEDIPTLPDKIGSADDESHASADENPEADTDSASPSHTYGSGYPGDPKTKQFLANNCDPVFGFSRIVRFSWQTAQTIMTKSKGGAVLSWPDDVPEDQSWKPGGGKINPQAGAMDKFIKKSNRQAEQVDGQDDVPKRKFDSNWRDARYYSEKQLSLLRWPA